MEILIHGICLATAGKELINKKENNMAIVMSIKPEWCDKIFSGEKCFEVRKTVPRNMPTKVYVYKSGSGNVVGEFIALYAFKYYAKHIKVITDPQSWSYILEGTCLTKNQFLDYIGDSKCYYVIQIRYAILYKAQIPLSEFGLKRPPQSWCYTKDTIL